MLDLGRSFLASVERRPHCIAIVDGSTRLSYADWLSHIASVTNGLQSLGLRHGDHLLLVMQNRWQMATLHWACQFLGAIATPLNWRANAEDIEYCALNAEARVIAYDSASAEAVAHSPTCRAIPRIVVKDETDGTRSDFKRKDGDTAFDDLLGMKALTPLPNANSEDCSVMLYTSGTTGRPKGVPRTHRAERAATIAHIAQNQYSKDECSLGVMPLYHTMGLRSLLCMALVNGCFVCMPRFDAGKALRLIARENISHLYLVPTLYHDLLAHPDFAGADIASVRRLGFAGASMSEDLLKRLDGAFTPDLFVNHYGSSEIYTFSIDQAATEKPGSAGRAGINSRIRVVRLGAEDADALASTGEEGEIIADLDCDEAFEGYWKRPDADAKAIRKGWYFTGDTGYFDQDGDLFVTGRVDDMIISGGENISPVEIESLLSLHPAVDEVAVAGLADARWGQKVVAFIKRRSEVNAEDLDSYCKSSTLAQFKRPREYVFVQSIPKSPVGKILRRKLIAGDYERVA